MRSLTPVRAVSTTFVRFQRGNGSHCRECLRAHYSPSSARKVLSKNFKIFANFLTPQCVLLSNLLANVGLSEFSFGASVQCFPYGQVSYANPWAQGVMPISRPVPIMERSSPPGFCTCDAWPYSEKTSRARCHLDIGLFLFRPRCLHRLCVGS